MLLLKKGKADKGEIILCEPMKEWNAKLEQDVDCYEKVIRSIDDDESDEVVIILSKEMLLKAGIEIGGQPDDYNQTKRAGDQKRAGWRGEVMEGI